MSSLDALRIVFGLSCFIGATVGLYNQEWMMSCAYSLFYIAFEFGDKIEE